MNTIKDFIWFVKHSWSYMQGQRKDFFTGFWKAWLSFKASAKADRAIR